MSNVRVRLLLVVSVFVLGSLGHSQPKGAPRGLTVQGPNIVLILSDDQRWDTVPIDEASPLPANLMPSLDRLVVQQGVSFSRAFVTNPVCCAMRASFLAGGYSSSNTGVIGNRWPNGGARRFQDARSLATLLKQQGYRTALVGKYLNEWESLDGVSRNGQYIPRGKYVPPGWDVFISKPNLGDWYRYPFVVGTSKSYGPAEGLLMPNERQRLVEYFASSASASLTQALKGFLLSLDMANLPYVTDFEKDASLAYLSEASRFEAPFFLMIAAEACHGPAVPEPEDQGLYSDFSYQARAWGEADLSDKPEHVQALSWEFDNAYQGGGLFGQHPDEFLRDQLRSLRSLDRLVEEVVGAIDADPGLRDRTVVIFASDNGLLFGEHRLFGKQIPYEESLRVPLVIRAPGAQPQVVAENVAVDLDLAATVLDLAGMPQAERDGRGMDGISLQPYLAGAVGPIREELVLQTYRFGIVRALRPSWAALRTSTHKLIDYDYIGQSGPQEELYDLIADPLELASVHADPAYQTVRDAMAQRLQSLRGVVIEDIDDAQGALPNGRVGQPYEYALRGVGGTAPHAFDLLHDGSFHGTCPVGLPPGLSLDAQGRVAGTPLEPGCWEVVVRIVDSSVSPQHGGPQWCVAPLQIVIDP
ncbi:MAG: sulfatase-like hydrolase/transferase [Planctomycetota bacterium]